VFYLVWALRVGNGTMDDDGSALHVGAKYKSFTDLECAIKKFEQDNHVQLYKRSSRKLGTGSKYASDFIGIKLN
jgi:hypothetical protein